jgi:iron complex outermembrane receptor protein
MHELRQDIGSVMQWYEKWHGIFKCLTIILLWISFYTEAAAEADLTDLSIEELMSRKVVTASRSEQNLSDTAAAVFVINQDDIRRSGVNTIPEVLRMAPGLQVARIDSNKWSVTARGFNGRFANKLLVLIDGRSVYTPRFSGVFWEVEDLPLEDIDRIEIIRGPGASVWGANAVNGIISIITKHAADTKGTLISLTAGNNYQGGAVRYGTQFAEDGHIRAFVKYFRQDGLVDLTGHDAEDDWDIGRGGFRMDWRPQPNHSITSEGGIYNGTIDQNFNVPSLSTAAGQRRILASDGVSGAHFLTKWEYMPSFKSRFSTQFYWSHLKQNVGKARRDTFDLDFHHELALAKDHEFSWGLGYRISLDKIKDTLLVTYSPRRKHLHLISAFLHDSISFFGGRMKLTVGSKFEYHTY